MTNGGRGEVCASIIGYVGVVELYLNIKILELAMIDLLLWGGLAVLIGGIAVIAARKPTV